MTEHDQPATSEYLISRRTALVSLAMLSTALLTKIQSWPVKGFIAQEFLSQCTTSITTCYELLKGDGLAMVEYTLPQYLPHLIKLATTPSPTLQKEAAFLAAQGCCLMSTVRIHRLQYRDTVGYCKQAVNLAKVTGNKLLLTVTLTHLGNAYFYDDQRQKYLEAYQTTEHLLKKEPALFPSRLQSRIFTGLSDAHACLGQKEEAEYYLGLANAIILSPDNDQFIPGLAYDISNKIALEAMIQRELGELEEQNCFPAKARAHYENAATALAQREQLPQSAGLSELIRLVTINQRQLVAVKLGDMEQFELYLKEGARGAKALGSQKRLDEAIKNWRAARKRWPNEKRVMDLDEWLF